MIEQPSESSAPIHDNGGVVSGSKSTQTAYGDYSAVAGAHGTAIVNVYQQASPRPIGLDEIEKGKQYLAALPRDTVPEIANLPSGSRTLFSRNPLFVGREDVLKALAEVLK